MSNMMKDTLTHIISVDCTIRCIRIVDDNWRAGTVTEHLLKMVPTSEELRNFLYNLNIEYNAGFGTQRFFGTIWFTDGTWSTRQEYDGSEWWEHHTCPPIPEELK